MDALIRRPRLVGLAATAYVVSASIAIAAPEPYYKDNWLILSDQASCSMAGDYQGTLSVMVVVQPEYGNVILAFTHPRWKSVKHEQRIPLSVQFLPGSAGWKGEATAINDATMEQPIIGLVFDPKEFARHWRPAIGFVLRSEGEEVGRYTLRGSAAALDAATACANRQWAEAQAERQRQVVALENAERANRAKMTMSLQRAEEAIRRKTAAGTPVPILPTSWVGGDDWPSGALREGREGIAGYSIDVGTNGMPVACAITSSSGHADLDDTTCTLLMRRARFHAAKDGKGNPIRSVYTGRMRWAAP